MSEDQAPFPGALVRFLERDRDGHVAFCYARLCGAQSFVIRHASELVKEAQQRQSAKFRARAIERAAEFINEREALDGEIDRQWTAFCRELRAARAEAA